MKKNPQAAAGPEGYDHGRGAGGFRHLCHASFLMFQRTVTLSSHVMQSSEDVRRQTERLYDAFYQQTAYTTPAQSPELAEEKKEKVQTYTFQGESAATVFRCRLTEIPSQKATTAPYTISACARI